MPEQTLRLLLVRHGQTAWASRKRIQGQQRVGLDKWGRKQATLIGQRLINLPIKAMYSSDLPRSLETAEAINKHHGLPITLEPGLREFYFRELEGLSYDEAKARYPELYNCKPFLPLELASEAGGETLDNVLKRVLAVVENIQEKEGAGVVALVSHSGPLRLLLCHMLGMRLQHYWGLRIDHCALTVLDLRREGALLNTLNDTQHLAPLLTRQAPFWEYDLAV